MIKFLNSNNIRIKSWGRFFFKVAGIIIIASASLLFRLRLDLTEDKRYTLSEPTINILSHIRNDIFIQVYLSGDIPIPLKRLKRSVKEMLDEFRVTSGRKIDYEFINPAAGDNQQQRDANYKSLISKGINPVNLQAGDAEGGSLRKLIFPGMIINYNGIEIPVNFLRNNGSIPYEQNILNSIEGLEYEIIQTIATISSDTIRKVAFLEGQDEIPEIEVADITYHIAKFFTIDRGTIGGKSGILDKYSAVIIAGPEKEFSEKDKLVLDQYIMNGGKVIWCVEEVSVNSDSLIGGETIGLYRPLNIEDQLFRYGVRINPAIVQDIECALIRLSVKSRIDRKQIIPAPWVYYPLLSPVLSHPITRNLNKVKGEFINYIDTVGLDPAIKKTILLTTSRFTRTLNPPLFIRLKEAELIPDEKSFNRSKLPVALLLEGIFPSSFRNRMTDNLVRDKSFKIKTESLPTKMIVIADGDIIRNGVSRMGSSETPYPLGQDRVTGQLYGNRDFLINCLNYLTDDNGIMELRSRELKLRLLDRNKVKNERFKWQLINIAGPVLMVILAGLIYNYLRKKKYTK
jgi:ABC-2 type transport system permease protein